MADWREVLLRARVVGAGQLAPAADATCVRPLGARPQPATRRQAVNGGREALALFTACVALEIRNVVYGHCLLSPCCVGLHTSQLDYAPVQPCYDVPQGGAPGCVIAHRQCLRLCNVARQENCPEEGFHAAAAWASICRPSHSATWGTTALPRALSLSTREGTPLATLPTLGSAPQASPSLPPLPSHLLTSAKLPCG